MLANRRKFIASSLAFFTIPRFKSKPRIILVDQRWIDQNSNPDGSIVLRSPHTTYQMVESIRLRGPMSFEADYIIFDGGGRRTGKYKNGLEEIDYPYHIEHSNKSAMVLPQNTHLKIRLCQFGKPENFILDHHVYNTKRS